MAKSLTEARTLYDKTKTKKKPTYELPEFNHCLRPNSCRIIRTPRHPESLLSQVERDKLNLCISRSPLVILHMNISPSEELRNELARVLWRETSSITHDADDIPDDTRYGRTPRAN